MAATAEAYGLDLRARGILILAAASTRGDAYCSLAWGTKVAGLADTQLAAAVLRGEDEGLTPSEQALAGWARHVVRSQRHRSE